MACSASSRHKSFRAALQLLQAAFVVALRVGHGIVVVQQLVERVVTSHEQQLDECAAVAHMPMGLVLEVG